MPSPFKNIFHCITMQIPLDKLEAHLLIGQQVLASEVKCPANHFHFKMPPLDVEVRSIPTHTIIYKVY